MESSVKHELLERLRSGRVRLVRKDVLPAVGSDGPLAFAQEPFWLEEQRTGSSSAQTLAIAYRISGVLNADALEHALAAIVERHDSLRTAIVVRDGVALREVRETPAVLRRASSPREATRRLVHAFANEPFRLDAPPLCRFLLLREAPDEHVLAAAVHHLAADGWSLGVFVEELSAQYARFAAGAASVVLSDPAPYALYAAQSRDVPPEKLARAVELFAEHMRGPVPGADLARGLRDPATAPPAATFRAALDGELRAAVERFAAARSLSAFTVLLAVFQLVLGRFDEIPEVVVGIPVADRRRAKLDRTIGCFVNTVAVRARLDDDPPFEHFVRRVGRDAGAVLAYGDVPLAAVLRGVAHRPRGGGPLFSALFVHNAPAPLLCVDGARVERIPIDLDRTGVPISFALEPDGAGFSAEIRYDAKAFDAGAITALFDAYACALERASDAPERSLSRISLLTPAQARAAAAIDAGRERPLACPFVDASVGAAARRDPARVAVVCGDDTLTYGALNAQVDAIASALRQAAGANGARVAILVERSVQLPVALLATLRSGCAFVPLDPRLPVPHLRAILAMIAVDAVLHSPALAELACEAAPGVPLIATNAGASSAQPRVRSPQDAAYVIATSGSTGLPKGVAVSHASLANAVASFARYPGFGAAHVFFAVTTVAFDIASLELLLPLAAGGLLVVATYEESADPWALSAALARSGATHLQGTPSLFRALVESGWSGAHGLQAWVGGEALTPALAAQLDARVDRLYDVYGPTETTIWSTAGEVDDPASITVGEPIDNTRVYVLDRHGEIVPFGARGEIAIAGAGVALGYVGEAPHARERFVRDRFAAHDAAMFLTGDFGRRLRDGRVIVHGRNDDQVKIRGFRVDLGAVDAQLASLAGVVAASASVQCEPDGEATLIGHLVTAKPFDAAALGAALRARVPLHMVPTALVRSDGLPLTANGKVDRKALPVVVLHVVAGTEAARPSGERERRLCALFEEVLARRGVGRDDDLYDVGGNSIDAVRILARVRTAWDVEIPLAAFLAGASSPARLAAEIERRAGARDDGALRSLFDDVEAMSEDAATSALAEFADTEGATRS